MRFLFSFLIYQILLFLLLTCSSATTYILDNSAVLERERDAELAKPKPQTTTTTTATSSDSKDAKKSIDEMTSLSDTPKSSISDQFSSDTAEITADLFPEPSSSSLEVRSFFSWFPLLACDNFFFYVFCRPKSPWTRLTSRPRSFRLCCSQPVSLF
jgi:hypothetical protein